MRSREVWIHAVDLNNGATFHDIPTSVLAHLLHDITGAWRTRGTDHGLLITTTSTDLTLGDTTTDNPTVITGSLPAVVQWAAGRGHTGVTATQDGTPLAEVPAAPKWI
jgi:maleylpyruvate isomerase